MTEKSASVLWTGAGKEGLGKISTDPGALMDCPHGSASPTTTADTALTGQQHKELSHATDALVERVGGVGPSA